jgi:cobyrinic acid a,c-diamide synthase
MADDVTNPVADTGPIAPPPGGSMGAAMRARHCPALLVGAPASGQGKTTATAALARRWRDQGLAVRVFKAGPDFLDPTLLEQASGAPVHQLDLWMGGEAHGRELLWRAAGEADVILVEGVMGLLDGTPSSADLALCFGLPVLAVIDGSAMAQTFGALALGLASYREGLVMAGVLANRVGSAGHAQMLRESLRAAPGSPSPMRWFGALPRDSAIALPSRHLGLVQAQEVVDVEQRLQRAAQALQFDASEGEAPSAAAPSRSTVEASPALPPAVRFEAPTEGAPLASLPAHGRPRLAGLRVAVARDAAFAFLYRANLDTLQALGAELAFFSPLANEPVPDGSGALYLPGGYPELHLDRLAANTRTRASVRAHHAQGRPLVAECGGMLALLETLADAEGRRVPLWGLLPGDGQLQKRLVNLGMHALQTPQGEVRGHTFHHVHAEVRAVPAARTEAQRHHGRPEAVYRQGRLHASFLHLYFPSNPAAVAALFAPS